MGSSELLFTLLEEGEIPLPDLDKKLDMDRTEILERIKSREEIVMSSVFDEEREMAYHVVKVKA
ncbi:MAG: hypothetical protein ABEJ36_02935 [Candidatus Nanosalina sp.]